MVDEQQKPKFGVYVNRASRGTKYWFISMSVPIGWMDLGTDPEISLAALSVILTDALRPAEASSGG